MSQFTPKVDGQHPWRLCRKSRIERSNAIFFPPSTFLRTFSCESTFSVNLNISNVFDISNISNISSSPIISSIAAMWPPLGNPGLCSPQAQAQPFTNWPCLSFATKVHWRSQLAFGHAESDAVKRPAIMFRVCRSRRSRCGLHPWPATGVRNRSAKLGRGTNEPAEAGRMNKVRMQSSCWRGLVAPSSGRDAPSTSRVGERTISRN